MANHNAMILRYLGIGFLLLMAASLHGQILYYWVGGAAGDWQNPANWSFNSGGFGNAGVPLQDDDAIFDGASFAAGGGTVTILNATSANQAACRNIDMSAAPAGARIVAEDQATLLEIYGSMSLGANVDFAFDGTLVFKPRGSNNTISTMGVTIGGPVIINGINGRLALTDDLDIANVLDIQAGELVLDGHQLSVEDISFSDPGSGADQIFDMTNSRVVLTKATGSQATFDSDLLLLDAANSSITFVGEDGVLGLGGNVNLVFDTVRFVGPRGHLSTQNVGSRRRAFTWLAFEDDGRITGEHGISNLALTNGRTVTLENGRQQTIRAIVTLPDACDGDARLVYEVEGGPRAMVFWVGPQSDAVVYFRGIEFDSQTRFPEAYDGGDNVNLDALGDAVVLYWVGDAGDGDWHNKDNWATTSNGVGGVNACVPKSVDNVVFDANSFAAGPSTVFSDRPIYLNSFRYEYPGSQITIRMPSLTVLTDLNPNNPIIDPRLEITELIETWDVPDVYLISQDQTGNSTFNDNLFLNAPRNVLRNLHITGDAAAVVRLIGKLNVLGNLVITGPVSFITEITGVNYDITAVRMSATGGLTRFDISGSTITILDNILTSVPPGSVGVYEYPVYLNDLGTVSADGATWRMLTNLPGFQADRGDFGTIVFEDLFGRGTILSDDDISFTKIETFGDADYRGQTLTADTLLIHPLLNETKTHSIEDALSFSVTSHMDAQGESCAPIVLTSLSSGAAAIDLSGATSELRFLQISNVQEGSASSTFAGDGSTDRGGNTSGWTFPTQAEIDEFFMPLGRDAFACADVGIAYDLSRYNGSGSGTIVLWTLNSTPLSGNNSVLLNLTDATSGINVDGANMLTAEVTTPVGCVLPPDTVMVDFGAPIVLQTLAPITDVCQGKALTLDPGYTEPDATFTWTNTSSTTPIGMGLTLDVTETDTYTVTVERKGCRAVESIPITKIELQPFPTVNWTADTTICETESFMVPYTAQGGTRYEWINTGATSGDLEVSVATQRPDSLYIIEVEEGACSDLDTMRVTFNPAVTQVLTSEQDTMICEEASFDLRTVGVFDSLRWSTMATTPSLQVFASDITGTEIYSVTGYLGACQATESREVEVITIQDVMLDDDAKSICSTEPLNIEKPSSITIPHEWFQVDGNVSLGTDDILNSPVIPGATTQYALVATDGQCSKSDTIAVTVDLEADLSALPAAGLVICQEEQDSLEVAYESDIDYEWTLKSNGNFYADTSKIYVSQQDTFVLTTTRGACINVAEVGVGVIDVSSVDIGPRDTTLCEGTPITLDPGIPGSGINYAWTGDLPSSASMISPSLDGQYILSISTAGCSSEPDTIDITFDPMIVYELAADPTMRLCDNDSISYDINTLGSNADFVWRDASTGDDLAQGPMYTIRDAGSYIVDIQRGECALSDTLTVTTEAAPVIPPLAINGNTVCDGEIMLLDAGLSGAYTYNWSDGSTGQQIQPTVAGTYSVMVTELLTGLNCASMASETVTFNPLPALDRAYGDATICSIDSLEVTLDPSYLLSSINNGQVSGVGSTFLKNADRYIVSFTDANTCTVRDTFNLVVNPTPVINLSQDTIFICDSIEDRSISAVTGGPIPDLVQWHDFSNDQTYTPRVSDDKIWVTAYLITNGERCEASDTGYVRNQVIPTYTLDTTAEICADSTLTVDIQVSDPQADITWSNGDTGPVVNLTQAGIYEPMVIRNTCSAPVRQLLLTVKPLPSLNVSMNTTICEGELATLTADAGIADVLWSTGQTNELITVGPGTYTVEAEEDGCTVEDMIVVDSVPLPRFTLPADTMACDQVGIQLTIPLTDVDITWSTGDVGNTININTFGLFTAMAVTPEGCPWTDDINIRQRDCTRFTLDDTPNVFSPSLAANPKNQVWTINPPTEATIHSFSVKIFSRWGEVVYASSDINAGWDGKLNGAGETLNPGVYPYVIEVTYSDDFDANRRDVFYGNVTLID